MTLPPNARVLRIMNKMDYCLKILLQSSFMRVVTWLVFIADRVWQSRSILKPYMSHNKMASV